MQDDRFEWDDAKARANVSKHKVSFEDARLAFDDPHGNDNFDHSDDAGEDRFNLTGLVGMVLLTVTYVERDGRIRIISARRATRNEQIEYVGS